MIIDNLSQQKTYEWLEKYAQPGTLHVVTGYFTIGALAYLAAQLNAHIREFEFILGDITHTADAQERPLDLLNETLSVASALHLSAHARQAAAFLRQAKVNVKTLEPNFCHAKAYLFHHASQDSTKHFYLTGSSNLTEAGIGLKTSNNVELNIAEQGSASDYDKLKEWFDQLWRSPQAHDDKLIDGGRMSFKTYLLREIERIFTAYSPQDLYYKVLFELFGEQILADISDPDFNRQLGKLENTAIYNALYEFQQKGAMSLIRMLQKHRGAILADAVGLGKTWTALAVMKFFQIEGFEVILLCPKKLEQNWRQYLGKHNSRFQDDRLNYTIRFHTDLQETRLERYEDGLRIRDYFQSDKRKLIVIDESHNLRNSKSNRYKYLVETLLKANDDVSVLMLSATPINNTLMDIRNQFKLMARDDPRGFAESLGVRNLDSTFREAQQAFHEWREQPQRAIGDFIKRLPANFFRLTDALTLSRTRQMIEGQMPQLAFPKKAKPVNLFVTPTQIGHFDTFEEMFEHFPPMLSGYQPSFYIEQAEEVSALQDERLRDRFLVKMMYILMVKRLESSWFSCLSTVDKLLAHHERALEKVNRYLEQKQAASSGANGESDGDFGAGAADDIFPDEDDADAEDFTLGKRRKVTLAEIERAGKLSAFRRDLKRDIASLDSLHSNLRRFRETIDDELRAARHHHSKDSKLDALMAQIIEKRRSGRNRQNQKVLIFTVFTDTAFYLFEQLKQRGFSRLAVVSGGETRTDDERVPQKNIEDILERFAPYTKLFLEKQWPSFAPSEGASPQAAYAEWRAWIAAHDAQTQRKLDQPFDLLIATDCLSEGQNLQDCDFVVNYDIHWNPVRIIQRMGRIDRLGSPNAEIYGVNFWPSENINAYLNLQGRIEDRMITMKLAGTEVDKHFTETLKDRIEDEVFEQQQNERMMRQMQISWDDIEVSDQGLGFEDLSLEAFRQDLAAELRRNEERYRAMPKGLYTGFRKDGEVCLKDGIIALLGSPAKPAGAPHTAYASYELIYLDFTGEAVILNQKGVLEALAKHKHLPRAVPDAIDGGDALALTPYQAALTTWLNRQAVEQHAAPDGAIKLKMGTSTKDVIEKLKRGAADALHRLKQHGTQEAAFQPENVDLIVWFAVN